MSTDFPAAAVRDLVAKVVAMPLGARVRIRVDVHSSHLTEVQAALRDLPEDWPPVEVHHDVEWPPDSVHVRPWWPPTLSPVDPRTLTLPGQSDPPWLLRYLQAAAVLDVDVIRHGALRGCARVAGTCPACGSASLGLGAGGFVTCGNLSCTNPSAPSDALRA